MLSFSLMHEEVNMRKSLGVIYLALGRPYLAMAMLSAKSLRNSNPGIPYTIVTNVDESPPELSFFNGKEDKWIYVSESSTGNRSLKTSILSYSEYDNTIFLDCDTVVLGCLDKAIQILTYFDIALRLNRYPQKRSGKGDIAILPGSQVCDLPHWNSGVMLINRSDRSQRFFETWNNKFHELGCPYDQVSLVPTIFESDARVLSLDERWNATDPGFGRVKWRDNTIVFHYATNICNDIYKTILYYDRLVGDEPSSSMETIEFLERKRLQKRKQCSLIRFSIIRAVWATSSPVSMKQYVLGV